MRYRMGIFLIFIATFTIFRCSETNNNSEIKPGSIQFVTKSSDNAPYEKGIDAIPESDAIQIEWYHSEDPTVEGYRVYRKGKTGTDFQFIGELTASDDTSWVDEAVNLKDQYFYYVTSVNEDDVESVPSDTIDYLLLEKATGLMPYGNVTESQPLLQWTDDQQNPYGYIVKVQQSDNESFIWIYALSQSDVDYGATHQSVTYNKDGKASFVSLPAGDYRWRVDKVGGNNSGSESHWSLITIQ